MILNNGAGMSYSVSEFTTRQIVTELLDDGDHSIDNAAKKFGTSTRTLQRKLMKFGITYTQLVDEIRYYKACEMLQSNELKLKEISISLRFSDASSFTRAFERWSGICPREYRSRYKNVSGDEMIFSETFTEGLVMSDNSYTIPSNSEAGHKKL